MPHKNKSTSKKRRMSATPSSAADRGETTAADTGSTSAVPPSGRSSWSSAIRRSKSRSKEPKELPKEMEAKFEAEAEKKDGGTNE